MAFEIVCLPTDCLPAHNQKCAKRDWSMLLGLQTETRSLRIPKCCPVAYRFCIHMQRSVYRDECNTDCTPVPVRKCVCGGGGSHNCRVWGYAVAFQGHFKYRVMKNIFGCSLDKVVDWSCLASLSSQIFLFFMTWAILGK